MTSALTWLDTSVEQQQKVRELLKLFSEPGTRDELGIGVIRDTFSELLFPGTSVTQTRARYFLVVPWLFQQAGKSRKRGVDLLREVDRRERDFIRWHRRAEREDGDIDSHGLIGGSAGEAVKQLPSTLYWSGLTRLGILRRSLSQREVSEWSVGETDEVEDPVARKTGPWCDSLPAPPPKFPAADTVSLALTRSEAEWLRERIIEAATGTLLSHLVAGPRLKEKALWDQPGCADAPEAVRKTLEHARRFSRVMHGAALLHNLLIAEAYERAGATKVIEPVQTYRQALVDWASDLQGIERHMAVDEADFWLTLGPRFMQHTKTKLFVDNWIHGLCGDGATGLADRNAARNLVATRVRSVRPTKTLIDNRKLLGLWGGKSGASALDYRWPTVRQLILDIQTGLASAAP